MTWGQAKEIATAMGVAIGTGSAIVGGVAWLLREKAQAWLDKRYEQKARNLMQRLLIVEGRMDRAEQSHAQVVQSLEHVGQTLSEGLKRLSVAFERIAESQSETALTVARIEGTMERREGRDR